MRLNINMDGIRPSTPKVEPKKQPKVTRKSNTLDGVKYDLPKSLSLKPKQTRDSIQITKAAKPENIIDKSKEKTNAKTNSSFYLQVDDWFKQVTKSLIHNKSHIKFVLAVAAPGILLIVIVATITSYSQTNNRYQTATNDCKTQNISAQTRGLDTEGLECPDVKLGFSDYFSEVSYEFTAKNNTVIEAKTAEIENLIAETNTELLAILDKLELLEINPNAKLVDMSSESRLDSRLDGVKFNLKLASELLAQSLPKIDDLLNSYKGLITLLPPQEKDQANTFLDTYQNYTEEEKITNFTSLKSEIVRVQKVVSQNPPQFSASRFDINTEQLALYKIFSGIGFNNVYESVVYSNTIEPIASPVIYADAAVDQYIVKVAEDRGYKRRNQAQESSLVSDGTHRLQSEMLNALQEMQQEALKDDISIGLVSGYRSVEDQKNIFLSRFEQASIKDNGTTYTFQEILEGKADQTLDSVLKTTSIPGYSRHHTGYTVDITDSSSGYGFTLFKNTPAYEWVSSNNFLNAKRFGIIPSYPEGQISVGPNPEEWEFVWVGVEKLQI
ncbi:MAG: M15 family metallopeptidase [Patescibacteria group bacterium]